MFDPIRKTAALALLGMTLAAGATQATAQEEAATAIASPILLTVSGETQGSTQALGFDRAALMDLPATTIRTSTIWTDGVHEFTGVALSDLVDLLEVDGGTLLATAINDYTVEIPVSDAVEGGPIIAYQMDGAEMQVRDKGPLWIVYPYDDTPEYRSEVIYSRSIWQLDRIEVAG